MFEMRASQKSEKEQSTEDLYRLAIAIVVFVLAPFFLTCLLLGYFLLFACRENGWRGALAVAFVYVVFAFYIVGLPLPFAVTPEKHVFEFWSGALFEPKDFGVWYLDQYQLSRRSKHLISLPKLAQWTRYLLWLAFPGGILASVLLSKKEVKKWQDLLYRAFKLPFQVWSKLSSQDTLPRWQNALIAVVQAAGVLGLAKLFFVQLFDITWAWHLFIFTFGALGTLSFVNAWILERRELAEREDAIRVSDGFSLPVSLLSHHMHVLGESGFGKTTFLLHLIRHHVRHGRGLIFVDLKADTDTVSEVVQLCEESDRIDDLKLFDCSSPELSVSYNPVIRGNATEIKDKLVGSFTWENAYYKDSAQSFLLSVLRSFVWLRDHKNCFFTLKDVYQATLSPEVLVSLETKLNEVEAPTELKERVNELAHFLRNRESFKELNGLRTQLQLLIEAEFGPKLTAREFGLDLFEAIQEQKVVYILLDSQRYGESAKKLGKLILQDLKSASAKIIEEVPSERRVPSTIIVDEFADLATEQFVGFLNRARGSKVGVVVAHQEMSDLEALSTTIRDQVMGNTATTVSFLQKLPESAERLSSIAGTQTSTKRTRQITEEGLIFRTKQYTGDESEREVEEFVIHPNVFKNLEVGEAVFIGKYPSPWHAIAKISPPPLLSHDHVTSRKILKVLAGASKEHTGESVFSSSPQAAAASKTPVENVAAAASKREERALAARDAEF